MFINIHIDIPVYICNLHRYTWLYFIYTHISAGLSSLVMASHPPKYLDLSNFHGAKCEVP